MLRNLGSWCVRHRGLVLAAWLAAFGCGLLAAGPLDERLSRGPFCAAAHESIVGDRLIRAATPYDVTLQAVVAGVPPADPALATAVHDLRSLPGVYDVTGPAPSTDGQASLLTVRLHRGIRESPTAVKRLRAIGPGVAVGGPDLATRAMTAQTNADVRRAELIALPLTLIVACLVFRGLLAAAVPVIAAGAAIGAGTAMLYAMSPLRTVDTVMLSITTLAGLGLAIDYSLVLVTRYREERQGADLDNAIRRTMATAGRTVLYSALTVMVALSGLWVLPSPFYTSIGLAGVGIVIMSLLAAVTLTPALLGLFDGRLGPPPPAGAGGGVFARLARLSRRRPVLIAAGVAALLILSATPLLRVHLVSSPPSALLPATAEPRQVADLIATRFDADPHRLVVVVAQTTPEELRAWRPDGQVAPMSDGFSTAILRATGDPEALVRRLRSDRPAEYPIWVTGQAAVDLDLRTEVRDHAPLALALIALYTYLLLLIMTGSVLVPLKALVLNVLSLGAAFGVLVLVFQDGHLAGPLGVPTVGGLEVLLPVVVFAFVFGFSMDYEILLLTSIKERYDAGLPTDEAVEAGLRRSGRMITCAALLMCIVYAGFVAGTTTSVKQMGLSALLAIAIDATLVRCLLVPATMTLLRDWNWWAPRLPTFVRVKVGYQAR